MVIHIEEILSPVWGFLIIMIVYVLLCKIWRRVIRVGRWMYVNGYWFPKTVLEMRKENIVIMRQEMALLDQKIYELEHNINLEFHLGEGDLVKDKTIDQIYLPNRDSIFKPASDLVTNEGSKVWHGED